VEPFNIQDVYTHEASETPDFYKQIVSAEVLNILNTHMPAWSRADYRRFIEGSSLPKDRRLKIIEQIRIVLAEHYTKEAEGWVFE
jgi:hypothetical protein